MALKYRDNTYIINLLVKTVLFVKSTSCETVIHCGLQVWEEVDQSGED